MNTIQIGTRGTEIFDRKKDLELIQKKIGERLFMLDKTKITSVPKSETINFLGELQVDLLSRKIMSLVWTTKFSIKLQFRLQVENLYWLQNGKRSMQSSKTDP